MYVYQYMYRWYPCVVILSEKIERRLQQFLTNWPEENQGKVNLAKYVTKAKPSRFFVLIMEEFIKLATADDQGYSYMLFWSLQTVRSNLRVNQISGYILSPCNSRCLLSWHTTLMILDHHDDQPQSAHSAESGFWAWGRGEPSDDWLMFVWSCCIKST